MSSEKVNRRVFMDRLALFLNILSLCALALTYLAGIVSPERCWPLAFVAMGYPLLLGLTICFSVYWIMRRRWFVFLNIAFLLFRWDYVTATFQYNEKEEVPAEGIKVMTYNVRLFDYYNWSKNKNTRHLIYNFLFDQQPNIICFQEFYHDNTGYFPTIDTLLAVNSLKHMHVDNYTDKSDKKQLWGMATLSSYPILNKGRIDFEGTYGNRCIYTDLLIDSDTVRVYNVHLQSIRIGHEGFILLDELVQKKVLPDAVGGKTILRQMINGFQKRGQQSELVKSHMRQCPYPIILCGDFNDVPTSYAFRTLAVGMNDSFAESGRGFGHTFVNAPFFRIDNILFSKQFRSINHTIHPQALSDHLAVSAVLLKDQ